MKKTNAVVVTLALLCGCQSAANAPEAHCADKREEAVEIAKKLFVENRPLAKLADYTIEAKLLPGEIIVGFIPNNLRFDDNPLVSLDCRTGQARYFEPN